VIIIFKKMADMNGKKGDGMNQCPMCGGSGMMAGRGCCCGFHGGMGYGFGGGLLRVIVGLIVLGIVFSFGVLIGELKAVVGGGEFYRGAMMGSNYNNRGVNPMMGNLNNGFGATSTVVQ
jgi:hypothetical protein